jgi:hypothetical protein
VRWWISRRVLRRLLVGIVCIGCMFVLARVAYWVAAVYWLSRSTDCSAEVLDEAVSPDGSLIATAFERSCGATAGAQIVSIRSSGENFDSDAGGAYVYTVEGHPGLLLSWDGPNSLRVKIRQGGGRVFLKVVIWHGIYIDYE